MHKNTSPRWGRIELLSWLPLAAAAIAVATYVTVALLRVSYPYELEWMEGAVVEHLRRVVQGRALYIQPSMEFVPFIYPPLYYYAAAGVAVATGVSFVPLRIVSILASIGCFVLIAYLVRRETASRYAAVVAAGMFAAAFGATGAWYDTGRVDTLFLFLMLAAIALIRRPAPGLRMVAAGLLLASAFLTKQSALVFGAPLGVYALLVNWRGGLVLLATALAGAAAAVLLIDNATSGWFLFYTWEVPNQHALLREMLIGFWTQDILPVIPIAAIAGLILLAVLARRRDPGVLYLGAIVSGGVFTAWLSRLHSGGWLNVVIPAYAALAILFGVAIHHALAWANRANNAKQRSLARGAVYVAATLQFVLLAWNPAAQVPTSMDERAGDRLVARIAELPGTVYSPGHGYLVDAAGKTSHAHVMAINDVIRGGETNVRDELAKTFGAALTTRRFDYLLMDSDFRPECGIRNEAHVNDINWFCADIRDNYQFVGTLIPDTSAFWPVTGTRRRPDQLYVRRSIDGGRVLQE